MTRVLSLIAVLFLCPGVRPEVAIAATVTVVVTIPAFDEMTVLYPTDLVVVQLKKDGLAENPALIPTNKDSLNYDPTGQHDVVAIIEDVAPGSYELQLKVHEIERVLTKMIPVMSDTTLGVQIDSLRTYSLTVHVTPAEEPFEARCSYDQNAVDTSPTRTPDSFTNELVIKLLDRSPNFFLKLYSRNEEMWRPVKISRAAAERTGGFPISGQRAKPFSAITIQAP